MQLHRTLIVLLTTLLLPLAHAGSSGSPEVSDAAGDAPARLDVTKAWFTHDDNFVTLTIQLSDLAFSDPALNGESRAYYRVEFVLNGAHPLYAEGIIYLADSSDLANNYAVGNPQGVDFGAGTTFRGGNNPSLSPVYVALRGLTLVDEVAGTVTLKISRYDGTLAFSSGSVISAPVVKTLSAASPVGFAFLGGFQQPVVVDATAAGGSYSVA